MESIPRRREHGCQSLGRHQSPGQLWANQTEAWGIARSMQLAPEDSKGVEKQEGCVRGRIIRGWLKALGENEGYVRGGGGKWLKILGEKEGYVRGGGGG